MGNFWVKWLYRNVAVNKDLILACIEELDADKDGRITLGEVACALKFLWRKAKGKLKQSKKIKTLDE